MAMISEDLYTIPMGIVKVGHQGPSPGGLRAHNVLLVSLSKPGQLASIYDFRKTQVTGTLIMIITF